MSSNMSEQPTAVDAQAVVSLLALIADPKASKDRLQSILAAGEEVRKASAAFEDAKAALAQATAALDSREAALTERELEAHTERQRLDARRLELVAFAKELREAREQIMARVLRHGGMLDGYVPSLQTLPDNWAAFDRMMAMPADAQYEQAETVVEPVEHAVANTSLTRSRRTMRRQTEA